MQGRNVAEETMFGILFQRRSCQALFDHLVTWMLANMADAGNIYHNANYKAFKAGTKPAEVQKPAPQHASADPGKQPGKKQRLSEASKSKTDKKRKRRGKSSSDAAESSSSDE